MNQPIFAWQDIDKRTEIDDSSDRALINSAHFGFRGNCHNHIDCFVTGMLVLTEDLNRAIVIDIDRST